MFAIRDNLYIGKVSETMDRKALETAGIGAMLQLCAEQSQEGITHLFLALEDGQPFSCDLLQQGIAFIQEQQAAGKRVLLACGAGVSRSAIFAVAHLAKTEGRDLIDAYRQVVTVYRDARPHPVLWRSLCECFDEPFSLGEMARAWNAARSGGI